MSRVVWQMPEHELLVRLVGKERADGVELIGVRFDPFLLTYRVEVLVDDPREPNMTHPGCKPMVRDISSIPPWT